MYHILSPLPLTKFSEGIQNALFANYLALHTVALAHDNTLSALAQKLRSEGVAEEDIDKKTKALSAEILREDVEVELKKIERDVFRTEATKREIPITLAHLVALAPMFE